MNFLTRARNSMAIRREARLARFGDLDSLMARESSYDPSVRPLPPNPSMVRVVRRVRDAVERGFNVSRDTAQRVLNTAWAYPMMTASVLSALALSVATREDIFGLTPHIAHTGEVVSRQAGQGLGASVGLAATFTGLANPTFIGQATERGGNWASRVFQEYISDPMRNYFGNYDVVSSNGTLISASLDPFEQDYQISRSNNSRRVPVMEEIQENEVWPQEPQDTRMSFEEARDTLPGGHDEAQALLRSGFVKPPRRN